ncbi:MAG TPA: hypothetical protein VK826_17320 [Bacteroidia bacterium]|nr:hypothetical protein [Bacteroidia bacterium]
MENWKFQSRRSCKFTSKTWTSTAIGLPSCPYPIFYVVFNLGNDNIVLTDKQTCSVGW